MTYFKYVRVAKGVRHICFKCKSKRHEKFMRKTGKITNFAMEEWQCSDEYCGEAWLKQYGL